MDEIKQHCPQYLVNNDNLCFKSCCYNDNAYIIVLCKLHDTKTNESRTDIVNPLFAKYRGNKFIVLKIFSVIEPSQTIAEIQNSFYNKKIIYKTGEEISVDDFDDNLEKVCSPGIHYFKSVEAAFYYRYVSSNYSGTWVTYDDNGNKEEEGEYLNGKLNGKWIWYYDNGNKREEGKYLNGKRTGKWTLYYYDGNKHEEGEYLNDRANGEWIHYYNNGYRKIKYLNGKHNGEQIFYYENGNIKKSI